MIRRPGGSAAAPRPAVVIKNAIFQSNHPRQFGTSSSQQHTRPGSAPAPGSIPSIGASQQQSSAPIGSGSGVILNSGAPALNPVNKFQRSLSPASTAQQHCPLSTSDVSSHDVIAAPSNSVSPQRHSTSASAAVAHLNSNIKGALTHLSAVRMLQRLVTKEAQLESELNRVRAKRRELETMLSGDDVHHPHHHHHHQPQQHFRPASVTSTATSIASTSTLAANRQCFRTSVSRQNSSVTHPAFQVNSSSNHHQQHALNERTHASPNNNTRKNAGAESPKVAIPSDSTSAGTTSASTVVFAIEPVPLVRQSSVDRVLAELEAQDAADEHEQEDLWLSSNNNGPTPAAATSSSAEVKEQQQPSEESKNGGAIAVVPLSTSPSSPVVALRASSDVSTAPVARKAGTSTSTSAAGGGAASASPSPNAPHRRPHGGTATAATSSGGIHTSVILGQYVRSATSTSTVSAAQASPPKPLQVHQHQQQQQQQHVVHRHAVSTAAASLQQQQQHQPHHHHLSMAAAPPTAAALAAAAQARARATAEKKLNAIAASRAYGTSAAAGGAQQQLQHSQLVAAGASRAPPPAGTTIASSLRSRAATTINAPATAALATSTATTTAPAAAASKAVNAAARKPPAGASATTATTMATASNGGVGLNNKPPSMRVGGAVTVPSKKYSTVGSKINSNIINNHGAMQHASSKWHHHLDPNPKPHLAFRRSSSLSVDLVDEDDHCACLDENRGSSNIGDAQFAQRTGSPDAVAPSLSTAGTAAAASKRPYIKPLPLYLLRK